MNENIICIFTFGMFIGSLIPLVTQYILNYFDDKKLQKKFENTYQEEIIKKK